MNDKLQRLALPVCMDLDIRSVKRIERNDVGKYTIVTDAGDLVVEDCPLDVINKIICRANRD